jgi:hypothetical protein
VLHVQGVCRLKHTCALTHKKSVREQKSWQHEKEKNFFVDITSKRVYVIIGLNTFFMKDKRNKKSFLFYSYKRRDIFFKYH